MPASLLFRCPLRRTGLSCRANEKSRRAATRGAQRLPSTDQEKPMKTAPKPSRSGRAKPCRLGRAPIMLAILLSAASGHAAAQQVVQIGGSGGPEVVVNWAALYGPAATAGIVSSPLAVRPAARGRGHALLIPNLGTSAPVLQAVAPRATRPVSPPPAAAVTTTAPPARQAAPTVKTPSPPPAPARTAVPAPARPSKPAKRQTARLTPPPPPPPVVVKPAKTAPTAKVAAPPPPTMSLVTR